MKITTDQDGILVIGEVFSGAYIETSEGNRIGFCLRDDTIEINVLPKGATGDCWHRVDMETGQIREMDGPMSAGDRCVLEPLGSTPRHQ